MLSRLSKTFIVLIQFGSLLKLSFLADNPDEEKRNVSPEPSEIEDSNMERLRRFLTQKLRLVDSSDNDQSDELQQKVLRKLTLDGIVEFIKESGSSLKIVTMAGAGISTGE